MKKQHFSLVELLVVIAIIAILAGLIIPTVGGMREKARMTQAKAEMNAIKTAILAFESTYGVLPLKDTTGAVPAGDIVDTTGTPIGRVLGGNVGYNRLMEWLTQSECDATAGIDPNSPNTRKIKFLDPRPTGGPWLDPWGQEYVIWMDHDYDGKVEIKDIDNSGNGDRWNSAHKPSSDSNKHVLNGSVFIYSWGPNKNEDWGLNNANGGAKSYEVTKDGKKHNFKTDDINTWDK
ncbi:MAG: prepilin-type N-terminal cleavage/methylation domain-containing protein [Victivallales bacterium]|nr:prepilin-type N-terminal cleavage/methylation domain-containing protein [Victivallales bacterium]